ncbi:response regulator [Echinicola jeungdonensis]|uniref:histidine kinase n=1 Tax=Echinicola jeungdonensis TaxID=709343 RepID=A0ABV5J7X4_9BACT|nr:response regulator [Echinicola jeungdonensis]MDN3668040.1 response regulator [Echinicola jeungdonensis]
MRPSLKIALIYIFIGGTWVAFSSLYLDVFMEWFQLENSNYLEAVKAVLFVIVSGLIMYGLIERSFRLEKKIRDQYLEIFETSPIPMFILDREDLKIKVCNQIAKSKFDLTDYGQDGPIISHQFNSWDSKEDEMIKAGVRVRIPGKEIEDRKGNVKQVDIYSVPFFFKESEKVMVMMVDNTRIHQILEDKERLNRDLQFQNERLKKFSFINSHNIRSPLANIIGIINLMGDGNKPDKDIVQMLKLSSERLDKEIRNMNELLQEQEMNPNMEANKNTQEAQTILFVDDDKVQHMINKRILLGVQSDLDLHFFANPMDALEWLENNCADILLLDINMPEMNGWEFLDRLKTLEKQPVVKMLSSSIDPNDEIKSQKYEMVTGFLTKPLNKDRVMELLEL